MNVRDDRRLAWILVTHGVLAEWLRTGMPHSVPSQEWPDLEVLGIFDDGPLYRRAKLFCRSSAFEPVPENEPFPVVTPEFRLLDCWQALVEAKAARMEKELLKGGDQLEPLGILNMYDDEVGS